MKQCKSKIADFFNLKETENISLQSPVSLKFFKLISVMDIDLIKINSYYGRDFNEGSSLIFQLGI